MDYIWLDNIPPPPPPSFCECGKHRKVVNGRSNDWSQTLKDRLK